jgi:hypothetical protein
MLDGQHCGSVTHTATAREKERIITPTMPRIDTVAKCEPFAVFMWNVNDTFQQAQAPYRYEPPFFQVFASALQAGQRVDMPCHDWTSARERQETRALSVLYLSPFGMPGKKCLKFVGVPVDTITFQCGHCRHVSSPTIKVAPPSKPHNPPAHVLLHDLSCEDAQAAACGGLCVTAR